MRVSSWRCHLLYDHWAGTSITYFGQSITNNPDPEPWARSQSIAINPDPELWARNRIHCSVLDRSGPLKYWWLQKKVFFLRILCFMFWKASSAMQVISFVLCLLPQKFRNLCLIQKNPKMGTGNGKKIKILKLIYNWPA